MVCIGLYCTFCSGSNLASLESLRYAEVVQSMPMAAVCLLAERSPRRRTSIADSLRRAALCLVDKPQWQRTALCYAATQSLRLGHRILSSVQTPIDNGDTAPHALASVGPVADPLQASSRQTAQPRLSSHGPQLRLRPLVVCLADRVPPINVLLHTIT